jgi:hypothetical protein
MLSEATRLFTAMLRNEERRNDYLIGSKDFTILEVAISSSLHGFFLEIYSDDPNENILLLRSQ